MMPRWVNLNELDRAAFHTLTAFLRGRLSDRATVDWALRLKPSDTIKRFALLDLIDGQDGRKIGEPWLSAWRLIEESWNNPTDRNRTANDTFHIKQRLKAGDRSGMLISEIVDIVAPRLEVEPFSNLHLQYVHPPKRPKKPEDLFLVRLTSGEPVDPSELKLGGLTDRVFLRSLALALDAVVLGGLDIARRIGWDGEHQLWRLGVLNRVYYVSVNERTDKENEPDEFHTGIAPSVKLLHAVVSRLVDIDLSIATEFVSRWKLTKSPIHLRLWAALSEDSRVTPAEEAGAVLMSLDNRCFWYLQEYPEIAELRAKRFAEFNTDQQKALAERIRKLPPRKQWPKGTDDDRVKEARVYWAVRELRRIAITGATLPKREKDWLDARIKEHPDLFQMHRTDEGFMTSIKARFVPPNPDNRYDLLSGEERLRALESALSSARTGWDEDPAGRATDWIRLPENAVQVIADFNTSADGGSNYANVWNQFGWVHSPAVEQGKEQATRDLKVECAQVLSLLTKLPDAAIRKAIDGISHWLSTWEKLAVALPEGLTVWLKLWPIAVEVTNAKEPAEKEINLNTIARSSDDHEPMDLDTLNTPVGKLVGVFLSACPSVAPGDTPFLENNAQKQMRDKIDNAIGPAGLIVKYRLIEGLRYFLRADLEWTKAKLIPLLLEDSSDSRILWRAIARQTQFYFELKIIGAPMVDRATDMRLARNTRRSLAFSLVIECLHANLEKREPVVPETSIQQMIRSLDDEVRAHVAGAIQRFVSDISSPNQDNQKPPSSEEIFRVAVVPFLQRVWPKERSLVKPGVSRALADLPAATHDAFAEAVDAIEQFLVPFDCWSMIEYGLYGEENGKPKLLSIDNQKKATALLRLLDLTIGSAEGAVIPHDLADALDQIRKVAPKLSESQEYRRLATAARRA